MSHLVFNLKDVPEDEARDIRELLGENEIAFYETDSGNWGISVAAIWVKDENESQKAKQLIAEYESERYLKVSREYEQELANGTARTFIDLIKDSPMQFIASILAIIFILYIMIYPFFNI